MKKRIMAIFCMCILFSGAFLCISVSAAPKVNPTKINSISQTVDRTLKITWTKKSSVTGYKLYYKISGSKYKLLKTLSKNTTSYTHKNLKTNKTYYYKIRTYKTYNGRNYYGNFSATKGKKVYSLKISTPKITSVKQLDTTTLKIAWSKVSNASAYDIYYKISGGSYKKLASISSSKHSYTHNNLKPDKKYFYKVRARKTILGKMRYSKTSSIVGKKLTNSLLNLYQPYYTYDCDIVSSPSMISMGGDPYYDALQMSFRGWAIFNLKSKYQKISFVAGALGDGSGPIAIYADDECVWSHTVNTGDLPKKFVVNIENASKLEIKCESNHIAGYSLALANIKVYK